MPRRPLRLEDLAGRVLAVDAYNTLYQFLATIRQPDGTPLKDQHGHVTSHLSGLLYRTTSLAGSGVRLAYVFDGKPPELKFAEIARRRAVKDEAAVKFAEAQAAGRDADARKYAQATSHLSRDMTGEAKRLLDALGVPWVQAPSEGEAQAASMAASGAVWAAASQDHDSLLFGTPRVVRNLTVTGRRKIAGQTAYAKVEPEMVVMSDVLAALALTREQLVDIGILIGTDFNPGIRGVGPKTAVKLMKAYGSLEGVAANKPGLALPADYAAVRKIFLSPEVAAASPLQWKPADTGAVVSFMCGLHGFSEYRVRAAVGQMEKVAAASGGLERFF